MSIYNTYTITNKKNVRFKKYIYFILQVFIFDSNHYPDHNNGLMLHRVSEPNIALFIGIESRQQIATNEVRKYSKDTVNMSYYKIIFYQIHFCKKGDKVENG